MRLAYSYNIGLVNKFIAFIYHSTVNHKRTS
jgi:hypothetical protein